MQDRLQDCLAIAAAALLTDVWSLSAVLRLHLPLSDCLLMKLAQF